MPYAATAAGWAGLLASVLGVVASLFLVRAGTRGGEDEDALSIAQDLAREAKRSDGAMDGRGEEETPAPSARDFAPVITDLTRTILVKDKASRKDTRIGAVLLIAAFVVLILQSLFLIAAAE